MNAVEASIVNDGERLIPGRSHDRAEVIRHRSSYLFFRRIIERDLLDARATKAPVRILDFGCGVGHGTAMLAEIPGTEVVGVDMSPEAVAYAREHYSASNVSYVVSDAARFAETMPEFDYVTSRHMLEHVHGGLALGMSTRWRNRLLINVPYKERASNPHHVLIGIDRTSFPPAADAEFFFEDLEGATQADESAPRLNSIVYARRREGLPSVSSVLPFPFPAWRPNPLEDLGLRELDRRWKNRLARARDVVVSALRARSR
jgi:SAM-dependent methyltransferase